MPAGHQEPLRTSQPGAKEIPGGTSRPAAISVAIRKSFRDLGSPLRTRLGGSRQSEYPVMWAQRRMFPGTVPPRRFLQRRWLGGPRGMWARLRGAPGLSIREIYLKNVTSHQSQTNKILRNKTTQTKTLSSFRNSHSLYNSLPFSFLCLCFSVPVSFSLSDTKEHKYTHSSVNSFIRLVFSATSWLRS